MSTARPRLGAEAPQPAARRTAEPPRERARASVLEVQGTALSPWKWKSLKTLDAGRCCRTIETSTTQVTTTTSSTSLWTGWNTTARE